MSKKKIIEEDGLLYEEGTEFAESDGLEGTDFSVSKVRITAMIDLDLKRWLKEEAEKQGIGYQTYMNEVLKRTMLKSKIPNTVSNALAKLEARMKRVENLTKANFSKSKKAAKKKSGT